MDNIVETVKLASKEQLKYSSSFTKNGIKLFNGRSASFFRISANCSINPWLYVFRLIEFYKYEFRC